MKNYSLNKKIKAFTVVELLVVIVIIGILATIGIASYNNISNRAKIASLQLDLTNTARKFKLYSSQYSSYPLTLDANNCPASPNVDTVNCLKLSSGNTLNSYSANSGSFILIISNGSLIYKITDSTPPVAMSVLTLVAGSNGTVSGGGTYEMSSTVTITATPNSGYQFSSWSGSGCPSSASGSVTVSSSMTCTASFSATVVTPTTYNLTVGAGNTGGTTSPNGTFSYNAGTSVSISALASSGYGFLNWVGSGCPASSGGNVVVNSNMTCLANFYATVSAPTTPGSCSFSYNSTNKNSTASWGSSSGATSYTVTFNDISGGGAGSYSSTVSSSPLSQLLTQGSWSFSVYASNSGGNSGSCSSNTIVSNSGLI
jgi:prepilin-type N-terminal cleavage/methylation domain-containing protein